VLGEVIVRAVDAGAVAVAMVIPVTAEAVCPFASVTAKVKALVPAFAGVPDKMPELVKPRPVLQAPEQPLIAQV
jgi:hypothetical protein